MTELIVAMNKKGGIGFQGRLPWYCKEELKLFKQKTMDKIFVVGRKTAESLPKLIGREIICISRNPNNVFTTNWQNSPIVVTDTLPRVDMEGVIGGGSGIYRMALENNDYIQTIHLSVIKGEHVCDTYFDKKWLNDFVSIEHTSYDDFDHYVLKRTTDGERQYLDLLEKIMLSGEIRDGRNGKTISLFKNDMKFDLRNGFPLLTTKKMFLRGILEEFLFFLRGDTDSKILEHKKVNIWKGNTDRKFLDTIGMPNRREGVLGPCYGYQWRFFNAEYDAEKAKPKEKGIDQLENIINLIRTQPHSRRIFMTSYNPAQLSQCVLPPCHSITIQFYVQEENLDMFCYNRSQDSVLGVPFNIASSALLLMTVAKLTEKTPRYFYMTMGDTHIYSDHQKSAEEQISRIPFAFPTLQMPDFKNLNDLENLKASDFSLKNYQSHPRIKVKMVA
jgi:thymidylate synthase